MLKGTHRALKHARYVIRYSAQLCSATPTRPCSGIPRATKSAASASAARSKSAHVTAWATSMMATSVGIRAAIAAKKSAMFHAGAGSTPGGYAIRTEDRSDASAVRFRDAHSRGSRKRSELHQGQDGRRPHRHLPPRSEALAAQ